MAKLNARDLALVAAGMVPAATCARWGAYALSTIHRAVGAGTLAGERINRRLYVDWASFRSYVGPLAASMPESAAQAVERASC